jgi:hypothetical protein
VAASKQAVKKFGKQKFNLKKLNGVKVKQQH